jgi:hypothetical protein
MAAVAPHITGYRDLELIGRGGFSEVYRAWQEAFDRWVALKVMTFEVHDDRSRERFRRECRTTGRFSGHPNVVIVHEADVTPDGRPYLAMQLYEGGSALGRLQRAGGPLPVDEVLAWAIQVAGALETGHRRGILHRDVKPGNILLTRFGQPVLSDFGLSILAEQQEISSGMDALTPNHAAPEVLERGEATTSTDIYALASTTYMLLAGRPPHDAATDEGVGARLLRMLREPVPPIDRPDVPASLRQALDEALSRDPADRPATALELADRFAAVRAELGLAPVEATVLDELRPDPVPLAETTLPRPGAPKPAPKEAPPAPKAPRARRSFGLAKALRRPFAGSLFGLAAVAVLLIGIMTLRGGDDEQGSACPALSRPPVPQGGAVLVGDVDGDGCDTAALWDGKVLLVEVEPDQPARRYQVGKPGDQLFLGDWDCDGTDTLGLYRPRTGERFLFGSWPVGTPLAAESVPGAPTGGMAKVVAGNKGCDELQVQQGTSASESKHSAS